MTGTQDDAHAYEYWPVTLALGSAEVVVLPAAQGLVVGSRNLRQLECLAALWLDLACLKDVLGGCQPARKYHSV